MWDRRPRGPAGLPALCLAGLCLLLLPLSLFPHGLTPHGLTPHEQAPHTPAGQDRAHGASAHAGDPAPPRLPAASPLVDVRVHAAEREFEIVVGPVSLPAGGPHLRPPVQLAELPSPAGCTGSRGA